MITARNEPPQLLGATVDGLRATTGRGIATQIIVVDDASRVAVAGLGDDVMVVRTAQPVGTSRAQRLGCALADGNVLVGLDAHMSFADGWLETMLGHSDGAVLCSAYCDYDLRPLCHGAALAFSHERDHRRQLTAGFQVKFLPLSSHRGVVDVPCVIGACYMMTRQTYEFIGGWSPLQRTWGCLEPDLCVRAHFAGVPVRCITDARVGHQSRTRFPYPVSFDDIEHNQLMLIHSAFSRACVRRMRRPFEPLDGELAERLNSDGLRAWRRVVRQAQCVHERTVLSRIPGAWPTGRPPNTRRLRRRHAAAQAP